MIRLQTIVHGFFAGLVIAERFRFHKRDKREGESINEYAAELQRLSEHCDFGTGLNDALRDRLVCGIRDEGVQKRLLTKENLTFDKALKMAEAAEQAGKNAAQFHDTSRLEKPLEDVHVVQSGGLIMFRVWGKTPTQQVQV